MVTVTKKNVRVGKTVYILQTDGKRHWLRKLLISNNGALRQVRCLLSQPWGRVPVWYSRRKAMSVLALYRPFAIK